MLTLTEGLKHSLIILEHLRNIPEINDYNISVGTFHNCRENGLTFTVYAKKKVNLSKPFTFCVYEYRSSDLIVINGKEDWSKRNDDLPYMGNAYDYLNAFGYQEHFRVAEYLFALIKDLF